MQVHQLRGGLVQASPELRRSLQRHAARQHPQIVSAEDLSGRLRRGSRLGLLLCVTPARSEHSVSVRSGELEMEKCVLQGKIRADHMQKSTVSQNTHGTRKRALLGQF